MEMTPQLRAWLVENFAVPVDASEEDFKAAAMKALDEGVLSVQQLATLSAKEEAEAVVAEPQVEEKQDSNEAIEELAKSVAQIAARLDSQDVKEAAPQTKSVGQKMMASAPANDDVRVIGADHKGKKFTGWELPIELYFNSRNHTYSTSELRRRVTQNSGK